VGVSSVKNKYTSVASRGKLKKGRFPKEMLPVDEQRDTDTNEVCGIIIPARLPFLH
jgi:hypothetical protein